MPAIPRLVQANLMNALSTEVSITSLRLIFTSTRECNAVRGPRCQSAPVRLSPPVYIYRCQQCTELGPTHRSQASRFYSTDKSVMNKYCFQTYTSYPSMGFDPLQGTKQTAIPVSLTDDMFALHSHIARRALADTMFSRLSTKTIPFLLTTAPVNENLRLHHRHWSP